MLKGRTRMKASKGARLCRKSFRGPRNRAWKGPVQGTLPDRQGNTEAELSAIDVPELDDAVEAVRILNDLSDSWKGANPGQRNRLLLAIFHGNYVDLGNREAWVCDP